MKEIKNFNERERQKYVPARVKVINVTVQRVLCQSTPNRLERYGTDIW